MKLSLLTLCLMALPSLAQEAGAESPGDASAQPAPGIRAALGARLGYGVPFGNMVGGERGNKLSDVVTGIIPAQIDVGVFLNSRLYVGASFQYALALLAEDCEEGCSARQLRFGINAAYHFQPDARFNPWLGLGFGYELLTLSATGTIFGQRFDISSTAKGFEFASLNGGVDYQVTRDLSVGPFVTFTAAQYSRATITLNDESDSRDIQEKAVHFWLIGGVRLQFRL